MNFSSHTRGRTAFRAALSLGVLAGLASACSSSDADSAYGYSPSAAPPNGSNAGTDTNPPAATTPTPPPEKELESSYRSPVATGRFVWIANPTSGRVALIDAVTLDVRTALAGNGPTYLAPIASPTEDAAIVLNTLSNDATLLRAEGRGVSATSFKVAAGANAWATSKDGRWAVSWTDVAALEAATPAQKPDKTRGFQDMTIIDLTGAVAPVTLAVGYRPVSVGFTGDSARVYAVTQDGISLVDLLGAGGPLVTNNVAISDTPLEDPGTRDVSVTRDGAYALVRRDGDAVVSIHELATGKSVHVTLPSAVTDLDLTDAGDRAVAVLRGIATAAILPVPAIFDDPTAFTTVAITGETIGSVALSTDGAAGVLYTNASASEHLTLLHLTPTPTFRVVRLYAPVLAVFPSFDAAHAVVLHDVAPTAGVGGAFSVVPLAAALPAKIVSTLAPTTGVSISPAGDRAVVTERSDSNKVYGAYLARMPSLAVDRYPLASPPIASGIVAGAHRAFVAQQHPEGRITFLDLDTGLARTLTGFELNARVVDRSTP